MLSNSGSYSQSGASTSSSLLERLKVQDPQAWERFVDLYGPLIYNWSRQTGLQPDDAADVMQDVFRSVTVSVTAFRHDGPSATFRGWLWTITRNKIRNLARQRAGRPDATGGTDAYLRLQELPEELDEPSTMNRPGPSLAQRGLELVKAEFESRTWQAFWQVTVEDRRPAEVAASLGMSVGAVYMAKSRVLRRLRDELADES
jgi:RNA polymerase sigma-70 factor (ECF subfamily)